MKVAPQLLWLFLIYILLGIIFYTLSASFNTGMPFLQTAELLSGSFAINIIVMLVFLKGSKLPEKSGLSYTLAAISLKFLLYFVLIITVYFLSKNRSLEFFLTFFVIYLSFTSYLLFSFVKKLKTKKIEK